MKLEAVDISFNPPKSDHRKAMDPEPGRCRRTDGRKWRCSRNVVLNQKYCGRHINRGHQRSRKHVEPNQTISEPHNKISNDDKISSLVTSDTDNRIATDAHDLGQSQLGKNGNHAEGKESDFENADRGKLGMAKNNYLGLISGFISDRYGSSPKSVLQCGAGKVSLASKDVIDNVPQRCLRTDGKKWQCKGDALMNQKYCQKHIHRGAKRLALKPQPMIKSRKTRSSYTLAGNLDDSINLNVVPASPRHGCNSTSSSSDETTITNDNINSCLAPSLPNC